MITDLKADFAIEVDFKRGSEAPSRIFRTISELIEAFHAFDQDLVQSIDVKIEPLMLLEDIESGSIKTWLSYLVKGIDDDALKNLDWKKAVGAYLVKAKYCIIKFLENKTQISNRVEIIGLERDLLALAQETDITDTRLDTESCGIVNSILQADTTAIFNQYQSWFNLRTSQYDAELNAFLDGYEGDKADWVTAMEAWTTATKAWYENSLAQFLNEYEAAKAQWLADMNAWFTTTTSTFETELLTKQEEYSTRAEDYLAQIESLIGDAEAGELLNRVRWLQENLGFIPIDAGDFFETYVDYSPDGGEF